MMIPWMINLILSVGLKVLGRLSVVILTPLLSTPGLNKVNLILSSGHGNSGDTMKHAPEVKVLPVTSVSFPLSRSRWPKVKGRDKKSPKEVS